MESRSRLLLGTLRELVRDPSYSSYAEINRAYREVGRLTHWNFLRRSSTSMLALTAAQGVRHAGPVRGQRARQSQV